VAGLCAMTHGSRETLNSKLPQHPPGIARMTSCLPTIPELDPQSLYVIVEALNSCINQEWVVIIRGACQGRDENWALGQDEG
jgi:hypothetical protein